MKTLALALAAIAAAFAAPAFAQQETSWDKIVLEEKTGNVMTSTGGEYQTADTGKQLVVGENMMLSGDASKAKVVYYDLDDRGNVLAKCERDYRDPNTYIIDASCKAAAGWTGGGNTAAVVAGAAVVGALLVGSDNVEPGPISGGSRL